MNRATVTRSVRSLCRVVRENERQFSAQERREDPGAVAAYKSWTRSIDNLVRLVPGLDLRDRSIRKRVVELVKSMLKELRYLVEDITEGIQDSATQAVEEATDLDHLRTISLRAHLGREAARLSRLTQAAVRGKLLLVQLESD